MSRVQWCDYRFAQGLLDDRRKYYHFTYNGVYFYHRGNPYAEVNGMIIAAGYAGYRPYHTLKGKPVLDRYGWDYSTGHKLLPWGDGIAGLAQLGLEANNFKYHPNIPRYTIKDVTKYDKVYVPGVPGTPAQDPSTVIYGRRGWDGGAYSIDRMPAYGIFDFKLDVGLAAIAGLAVSGIKFTYSTAKHAWMLSESGLSVLESGATLASVDVGEHTLAEISNWVLRIERSRGQIIYSYDKGEGGFIEAFRSIDSLGGLRAIGMPYSVDDHINAISMYERADIVSALPPTLAKMASEGASSSGIRASIPPVVASLVSEAIANMAVRVPATKALMYSLTADEDGDVGTFGRITSTIPAAVADMRAEPVFFTNGIHAPLLSVHTRITAWVHIEADLKVEVPALKAVISQSPVSKMKARIPAAEAFLRSLVVDVSGSPVLVGTSAELDAPVFLIAAENIGLSESTSIDIFLDMVTAERIAVTGSASIGQILTLLIEEGVNVSNGLSSLTKREALQYAVNTATGAISTYTGFGFDGFGRVNGTTYCWDASGVYAVGDGMDSGKAIDALVDFGISDFGTGRIKSVPTAWLGLRTDGEVYLRVNSDSDNGGTLVYKAVQSQDTFKAVTGKGLFGRQWSLKVEITGAEYASMDSVEIEIAPSTRRIGGRK